MKLCLKTLVFAVFLVTLGPAAYGQRVSMAVGVDLFRDESTILAFQPPVDLGASNVCTYRFIPETNLVVIGEQDPAFPARDYNPVAYGIFDLSSRNYVPLRYERPNGASTSVRMVSDSIVIIDTSRFSVEEGREHVFSVFDVASGEQLSPHIRYSGQFMVLEDESILFTDGIELKRVSKSGTMIAKTTIPWDFSGRISLSGRGLSYSSLLGPQSEVTGRSTRRFFINPDDLELREYCVDEISIADLTRSLPMNPGRRIERKYHYETGIGTENYECWLLVAPQNNRRASFPRLPHLDQRDCFIGRNITGHRLSESGVHYIQSGRLFFRASIAMSEAEYLRLYQSFFESRSEHYLSSIYLKVRSVRERFRRNPTAEVVNTWVEESPVLVRYGQIVIEDNFNSEVWGRIETLYGTRAFGEYINRWTPKSP